MRSSDGYWWEDDLIKIVGEKEIPIDKINEILFSHRYEILDFWEKRDIIFLSKILDRKFSSNKFRSLAGYFTKIEKTISCSKNIPEGFSDGCEYFDLVTPENVKVAVLKSISRALWDFADFVDQVEANNLDAKKKEWMNERAYLEIRNQTFVTPLLFELVSFIDKCINKPISEMDGYDKEQSPRYPQKTTKDASYKLVGEIIQSFLRLPEPITIADVRSRIAKYKLKK